MLGMQPAQVRVGLARRRDLVDDVLRIEQLRLAVEIGGELRCRIHDAATAGIARVLQRRQRERDLGVGELIAREGDAGRGTTGDRNRRIEAPVIGFPDLGDDAPRPWR